MFSKTHSARPKTLPWWKTLTFRAALFAILLASVPVILVVSIGVPLGNQYLQRLNESSLESIAKQKEARINEWVEAGTTTLKIVTENTAIFQRLLLSTDSRVIETRIANNFMAEVVASDPHIEDLFIYDLEGNVIAASSPRFIGRSVNRQPYFRDSLAADDFYIEPPFFNVAEQRLTLVGTDIVESENKEVLGVLAVILNVNHLNEIMLDRTGLGETGESYLVSPSNHYFLTPSRFEGYPQNRAYFSEGIDNAIAQQTGSGVYTDYRNIPVIGHYRFLPELQLVMLTEIDAAEGFAFTKTLLIGSIVGTSILLFVLAALASIYARKLFGPIESLTLVTTAISQGDLNRRVEISTNDEIGVLAKSFNTMADNLAQSIEQLNMKFSEVENANKQLKIANARVKEATRLKSEFLANMSHELRTPLNAIIGFTGIMLEGFAGEIDEDAKHMVKRVYDNSKGLLTLINDILDISKIEAGRLELVKAPFFVDGLADQWKNRTGILAEQKGLSFTVEVDASLPRPLYGDQERLNQVALNLLSNAIKFTEEGGVSLKILRKDHQWQIVVEDTGIGIPPHAHEYIFDEFRQIDGSSMRSYGGTGLGLAITRKLVLVMGGTISVESVFGKGSTFVVTLPIETIADEVVGLYAEAAN